jgi:DNA repair protein RadC
MTVTATLHHEPSHATESHPVASPHQPARIERETHFFWSERPRDRLRRLGVAALTDAELLTLVVGRSGRPVPDAIGHAMLTAAGGALRRLATDGDWVLRECPHIGRARRAAVQAAFELGRRCVTELPPHRPLFENARDVAAIMGPQLRDRPTIEVHVLALDTRRRLEGDITITSGLVNHSPFDARAVFRAAIGWRAANVVLVSNHPDGDPTPYRYEYDLTIQAVRAGRTLDLPVIDHVIIGHGRYFSFTESRLI